MFFWFSKLAKVDSDGVVVADVFNWRNKVLFLSSALSLQNLERLVLVQEPTLVLLLELDKGRRFALKPGLKGGLSVVPFV